MLDIDKPTLVKAEARGPLGRPGAEITVSSMMWIIPGRNVLGDGWVRGIRSVVDAARRGPALRETDNASPHPEPGEG